MRAAALFALLLAAANARAGEPARAARPVARFALVVGHNQPPRPDLPTLRYADDDAVR